MKIANVAELKNHLSKFLAFVIQGEEIEVRKHNIPIARVVPINPKRKNCTVIGCGNGSVCIKGDLTEPFPSRPCRSNYCGYGADLFVQLSDGRQ